MEGRGSNGEDRREQEWSGKEWLGSAVEDGTGKDWNGCKGMVRNGRNGELGMDLEGIAAKGIGSKGELWTGRDGMTKDRRAMAVEDRLGA